MMMMTEHKCLSPLKSYHIPTVHSFSLNPSIFLSSSASFPLSNLDEFLMNFFSLFYNEKLDYLRGPKIKNCDQIFHGRERNLNAGLIRYNISQFSKQYSLKGVFEK